jgi:hypothetical protein
MLQLVATNAEAFDWARSIGTVQRYTAHAGEPNKPADCVRHYRSFEVRNRMSTSARLKALRACTAARESKQDTKVADTARPKKPSSFRAPIPVPLPSPQPVVTPPAVP